MTVVARSVFEDEGKFYLQVQLDGIDINKINVSKECHTCHYWYFKNIGFKCEPHLCNGCHGLLQKAMTFNDVAIFYVK